MNQEKGPSSHAQLGSGRTGGNHWVPKSVRSESLCLMAASHPCGLVWGSRDGEVLVHHQGQSKSSYWTSLSPLTALTELFWLSLFGWLCILKSLYWRGQIHLTPFPGCPRYSSCTSFFEATVYCFPLLHCSFLSLSLFLLMFTYLVCIVLLFPVFLFSCFCPSCRPHEVRFRCM